MRCGRRRNQTPDSRITRHLAVPASLAGARPDHISPSFSHPVDGPVGNRSRPLFTDAERDLLCWEASRPVPKSCAVPVESEGLTPPTPCACLPEGLTPTSGFSTGPLIFGSGWPGNSWCARGFLLAAQDSNLEPSD